MKEDNKPKRELGWEYYVLDLHKRVLELEGWRDAMMGEDDEEEDDKAVTSPSAEQRSDEELHKETQEGKKET